jgi:hypothetical protein
MATNVEAILDSAVCPATLFTDIFDSFVPERAKMLAQKAQALIK